MLRKIRKKGQGPKEQNRKHVPSNQLGTHKSLKALRKESYDKLKAYEHLFYLLQNEE